MLRIFSITFLLCASASASTRHSPGDGGRDASAAPKPNMVLIFTDDQRHDAVGYAGNMAIHTPNLDRLANAGTIFRNCFVNTSICSVNRANIISGQYPGRHGIDDFFKTFSRPQLDRSVPARLRKAGYQTAFFGKWGIGDSPEKTHQGAAVFDYWAGQPMQTCFFHQPGCRYVTFDGFSRPLDDLCDCPADSRGKPGYRNRIGRANLEDPLHVDSTITPRHVARFLDGRDPAKPFSLFVFFKAPHSPFTDWDPQLEKLTDGREMPIPGAATLANAKREPPIIKQSLGWPSGQNYLRKPAALERHMRDYYRLVSSMDLGVGRIMDELKKRGLADNTVVLFTSDNGHYLGEHGLGGKWLMHEPSLRVPGFLHDPRKPGGRTTERMVITTDFSATMLALGGLEIPDTITGRDLTRLADNPEAPWRADFYYDHPYSHHGKIPRTIGVRTERHTYTRYIDPDPPFEQLFDLDKDPDQLHNLAADPEYAALLEQLRRRCDRLGKEVGPTNRAATTEREPGSNARDYTGGLQVRKSTVGTNGMPKDIVPKGSAWNFGPGSLWTHRGWQYAAYWDDARQVSVARRQLPAGEWSVVSLPGYQRTENGDRGKAGAISRGFGDGHEKVSMGISPDGVIHLSFDHHLSTLRYRSSRIPVADDPAAHAWSAELFGPVRDNLGGPRIESVTYPSFHTDGTSFVLYMRLGGGSGSANSHFFSYRSGDWIVKTEAASKFLDRSWSGGNKTVNAYPQGMAFHQGRRHLTWCWRDTPVASTCHDLCYAYSDDHGTTWLNNDGRVIARTGESFITADSPGVSVWPIPPGTRYVNGGSMTVDARGRVHVLARGEDGRPAHFQRDPATAKWTRQDAPRLGTLLPGASDRLFIATDEGLLRTSASDFGPIEVVAAAAEDFSRDSRMGTDRTRAAQDGWVSVIGQRGRTITVVDYWVGPTPAPKRPPSDQ